jgi:hypothetical protein
MRKGKSAKRRLSRKAVQRGKEKARKRAGMAQSMRDKKDA